MPDESNAKPNRILRWFHPTPGRMLLLLLIVEAALFSSENWFPRRWLPFSIITVAVAILLAFLWYVLIQADENNAKLKQELRWYQFSLRSLLVVMTVIAVLLSCAMSLYHGLVEEYDYEIAALDCGHGRQISIFAESSWELNQAVYYEVVVNGKITSPKSFMFCVPSGSADELRFDILKAEHDDLVGLVRLCNTGESRLVALYDFKKDESWPRLRDNEVSYAPLVESKWQDYFTRFRREYPTVRSFYGDD